MKIYFDHEKLQAYQSSLQFVRWSEPALEKLPRRRNQRRSERMGRDNVEE